MNLKFYFTIGIIGFSVPINSVLAQSFSLKKPPTQYLRLKLDNDMLILREKTDRYYSSGIKLNYTIDNNPTHSSWISKIFPQLKDAKNYHGYTLATNMYTPANITELAIHGDRPYAGWAYVGLTGISNSKSASTRFATEYTLGAIGPLTQQEFMQKRMHKIIDRPQPQGWKNQIANDIALNLSFVGEKRFGKSSENLELMGVIETNVGTVTNYMGLGALLRIGWFEDYFKNIASISKQQNWQIFVFARPVARIVADNALLQGGIFTYSKSPYVISKDDLKRCYLEAEFGYSLSFRSFNITYSQNVRTPEFEGAKNMFWGSVAFSYGL